MKTHDLIQTLTKDLQPTRTVDPPQLFWTKWSLAAFIAISIWLFILPIRSDLQSRSESTLFILQTCLWLMMALVSAWAVYRSRIPGLTSLTQARVNLALILFFVLQIFTLNLNADFFQSLSHKFSLSVGACGQLILTMSFSWAVGLFVWVRKGAPTQLAQSAAWIAFSSGCLASFAMQAICVHDEPLHAVVWHLVPVFAITAFSAAFAGRLLRW